MEIIDVKGEFRNSKILLIVLGTLLILVINSLDSLLGGLYKMLGLTIKNLLIFSISFHGLIIICLASVLYWIISSPQHNDRQAKIILSLRTLKIWGVISFCLIVGGAAINVFFKTDHNNASDISLINTGDLTISDLAYLSMTQTALMIFRNVLLFTIYFLIVFRRELN